MRQILMSAAMMLVGGSRAMPQDVASLIEKLASRSPQEADSAQEELLRSAVAAAGALREAASKSPDESFRRRARVLADRLDTRRAVAGLAGAWGDRWYAIYISSLKTGWVHLTAQEKDGQLLFTDELFLRPGKDQAVTLKLSLTCAKDEYLTPVRLTLDSHLPEITGTYEARVKEGRLIVSSGDQKQARRLKHNTVIDFALLRLVTILPETEGYPIALLELVKPQLKESATVRFDKEETIEVAGKNVKARRFIVSDGEDEDRFYWVGGAGQLYKMQAKDNVEAELCDEKRAKDLDTND